MLLMSLAVSAQAASVNTAPANLDLVRQLNQAFVDIAEKVSRRWS